MTEVEPVLNSLDANEPLYTAFDEIELTRMAVTDADLQAMRVTVIYHAVRPSQIVIS